MRVEAAGRETEGYCWLRVRIFGRKDVQSPYPVEAELDDGSWFAGELKLGEEELTELFALDSEVREYGIKLGQLLFAGQVLTAYTLASGQARKTRDDRLRIQLWISPACSELQAVRWERAFVELDGKQVSLAAAERTPFSRFTRLSKAEPRPIIERPLRLLVAIANPSDLPPGYAPIAVEEEVQNIVAALAGVPDLAVTLLPGRTPLSKTLRENLIAQGIVIEDGPTTPEALQVQLASHHILHYLGHGLFKRPEEGGETGAGAVRSGTSYLLLENAAGEFQEVSDAEMVARLAVFKDVPRLIFLAACETAKREEGDPHPFVGLGPKLVEAGFPAVVAMQDKVPMALARRLTQFFYRNLLQHGLIDRALNESRKLLLDENQSDWAIPVLFMRTPEGRLFAANPFHSALRAIAGEDRFQPRGKFGYLPLEAVLLTGGQPRAANWERVAQRTLSRVDLWTQTLEILKPEKNEIVCLAITGERGTARSTHLRRLVHHTAKQSLEHPDQIQVLPVYVDLQKVSRQSNGENDFLSVLAGELSEYWPGGMTTEELEEWLTDEGTQQRLRIIVDNLEDLPEAQHKQAVGELQKNVSRYFQRHQFVIALGHGGNETQKLPITHLLDVQPLSRRKIQHFLRDVMGRSEKVESGEEAVDQMMAENGEKLATALEKTQLFDLAAQPWLLVRMVERGQEELPKLGEGEIWPPSRASLLKEVIEDKVQQIPRDRGMQARALDTMYALANEMQFSRRSSLPLQEAIPIMARARGGREYGLEELLSHLIQCELMAVAGSESVRFLYSSLQAFCCAQALLDETSSQNPAARLEKITSMLGGINQVRWWFEPLVLLCGMLPNPDELLEQIVYGESFAETEKVFLAARCLLESVRVREYRKIRGLTLTETLGDQVRDALLWLLRRRGSAATQALSEQVAKTLQSLLENYQATLGETMLKKRQPEASEELLDAMHNLLERVQVVGSSYLADRVMEALIWRSSSVNEPRSYQRLRAIEEIGRLRRPEVVSFLSRIAMAKIRKSSLGKDLMFEYGGIRQSAGRSLRRLMPEFEADLRNADPALFGVIEDWRNRRIENLTALLHKTTRQATKEQITEGLPAMTAFALGDIQTVETRRILYDALLEKQTPPETRWAITDALALLDPEEVDQEVIGKLLPTRELLDDEQFQVTTAQSARWNEMLIYLIGQLRNSDPRSRKYVEKFLSDPQASFALKGRAILALGTLNAQEWKDVFERVALGDFETLNLDPKQFDKATVYLRIKALQALAEIGDRETLKVLRSRHKDWPPEVERVFYFASEEISWRLSAEG